MPTICVCFCETREDAERVQGILTEWLNERGLTLSEEKTRIVHLTEGFDFLGFNIRHYPAPKTSRTGWKLLIKPSKESVQEMRTKLKILWEKAHGTNVQTVLGQFNPVIGGWANYFRTAVAKEIFNGLDRWMFYKEDRYTRRVHPKKAKDWRHQRYWGRLHLERNDSWVFGDKQTGAYLLKFSWFPIERHTLVKGTSSPDDPRLKSYWMERQTRSAKDLTLSKQKLAKRQHGRCPQCGESLFNDEELQVHHLHARADGGKNVYSTLVLVYRLCHQHIHAASKRALSDCQECNNRNLWRQNAKPLDKQSVKSKRSSAVRDVLEPCALRGARTVLRGLGGSNVFRLPDLGFKAAQGQSEEIKRAIKDFLDETLKLELSEEKTLITHAEQRQRNSSATRSWFNTPMTSSTVEANGKSTKRLDYGCHRKSLNRNARSTCEEANRPNEPKC